MHCCLCTYNYTYHGNAYIALTLEPYDIFHCQFIGRRSLRLTDDTKDLAIFARRFGQKQLKELEAAYDSFATTHTAGSGGGSEKGQMSMACRDLMEMFLSMGRAVTITRLMEWMDEVGDRVVLYIVHCTLNVVYCTLCIEHWTL